MKLMKILDDKSVIPVSCLYFDGYTFGDRMLEGLVVKIFIQDEKLDAEADWPKGLDADYWKEKATQYAIDMDQFSTTPTLDDDAGFILFETKQD